MDTKYEKVEMAKEDEETVEDKAVSLPRVKVYEMNDSGNWDDKGTGHVTCSFVQSTQTYCILVKSETDGSPVLNSEILAKTDYQIQQETLVLWHDPSGIDVALSFQEQHACQEIISQIQEIQARLEADSKDIDQIHINMPDDKGIALASDFQIPKPTVASLEEIEQVFLAAVRNPVSKEILLKRVMETEFLEGFIGLLEECEDLEMIQECFRLSTIVKCIFFLNSSALYNLILQDPYFLIILGMLEYDREYPTSKAYHREYFTKQVKFNQILPFKDPELISKIHKLYRASFIKDVALARTLEDSTFMALNSFIFSTQGEILMSIQQDTEFLDGIFALSKSGTQEEKEKVIAFIQEICLTLKNFPRDSRLDFLKTLQDHGIYTTIDSLDILSALLENNPASVRSQILQNHSIMDSLLSKMDVSFHKDDLGVLTQLLEIFRLLLDPTGISASVTTLPLPVDPDLDVFLEYFYSNCADILFKPLDGGSDNHLTILCELVSFIIVHHALFCKKYLGGKDILTRISKLLSHNKTFVRLSALRVFKQTLATADEFYRRFLIRQEVFGKIVECLVQTKAKNNLINSACLEFFSMILQSDGMKGIIVHIVPILKGHMEELDYSSIFTGLLKKFDEYGSLKNDGFGKSDLAEDAYFEADDDEIATSAPVPVSPPLEFVRGKPLVPYTMEDEEEGDNDEIVIKTPVLVKKKMEIKPLGVPSSKRRKTTEI